MQRTPEGNLALLIHALNNLPADFKWDYGTVSIENCGCALHLAKFIGLTEMLNSISLSEALNLPADEVYQICFEYHNKHRIRIADVTAAMIADSFDALRRKYHKPETYAQPTPIADLLTPKEPISA